MAAIRIHFATNRAFEPRAGGGYRFKPEIEKPIECEFRVGRAEVEVRADGSRRGYRLIPESVHIYPERRMRSDAECQAVVDSGRLPADLSFPKARAMAGEIAESRERFGSTEMFAELQADMEAGACDALLFIHGFNNTFADAVETAAELADRYGEAGQALRVVLFSWPSEGKLFPPTRYFDDRTSARLSAMALGRALARLRDLIEQFARDGRRCNRRLHVMAHSMGNYALRFAVQDLIEKHAAGRPLPVFENAFLMAADADADALELDLDVAKLQSLSRIAQHIHVYHSRGDIALRASDWTKGNPDRLGAGGPRSMNKVDERVVAIDCREVDDTPGDNGNHNYFRSRLEVIEDVAALLRGESQDAIPGRRPIDGRRYRIEPGTG